MPVPIWRCTMKFSSPSDSVSETHYIESATKDIAVAGTRGVAIARAALLAREVSFEAWSVSPEKFTTGVPYVTDECRGYTKSLLSMDYMADGINVYFFGATKRHRTLCLRGIPQDFVEREVKSQELVVIKAARDLLDTYLASFGSLSWLIKTRFKVSEAFQARRITDFGPATGEPHNVSLELNGDVSGYEPGDDMLVSGCRKSARKANGLHHFVRQDETNVVTLDFPFGLIAQYAPEHIENAFLRKQAFDYSPIIRRKKGDPSSRKASSPFFVPPGKQSARPH